MISNQRSEITKFDFWWVEIKKDDSKHGEITMVKLERKIMVKKA